MKDEVSLLQYKWEVMREMPSLNLLQIIVGEFEYFGNQTLLYHSVIDSLLKKKFMNLFVARADEGIGENNDFRTYSFESVQFNNLPIKITVLDEENGLNESIQEINGLVHHGQISKLTAFDTTNLDQIPSSKPLLLKIYMDEKSGWFKRPVYNDILSLLNEHNLIWSTVKKGIHGFGSDKSPKKNPIVIEAIGSASAIKQLVPQIKAKVPDGIVIVIPVEVIENK